MTGAFTPPTVFAQRAATQGAERPISAPAGSAEVRRPVPAAESGLRVGGQFAPQGEQIVLELHAHQRYPRNNIDVVRAANPWVRVDHVGVRTWIEGWPVYRQLTG